MVDLWWMRWHEAKCTEGGSSERRDRRNRRCLVAASIIGWNGGRENRLRGTERSKISVYTISSKEVYLRSWWTGKPICGKITLKCYWHILPLRVLYSQGETHTRQGEYKEPIKPWAVERHLVTLPFRYCLERYFQGDSERYHWCLCGGNMNHISWLSNLFEKHGLEMYHKVLSVPYKTENLESEQEKYRWHSERRNVTRKQKW